MIGGVQSNSSELHQARCQREKRIGKKKGVGFLVENEKTLTT